MYDEDIGSDDVVGEGTCTLGDLCKDGSNEATFEINFKGKSAGTVRFETTWVNFHAAKEAFRLEEEDR